MHNIGGALTHISNRDKVTTIIRIALLFVCPWSVVAAPLVPAKEPGVTACL